MVKLADIPEYERNHLMSKLLPPLGERRIRIIRFFGSLPRVSNVNDQPGNGQSIETVVT